MKNISRLLIAVFGLVLVSAVACGTDRGSEPADGFAASGPTRVPPDLILPDSQSGSEPTSTPITSSLGSDAPEVPITPTSAPGGPPGTPSFPTATAAPTIATGLVTPTNYDPGTIVQEPNTPPGIALVALPFISDRNGLSSEQIQPHTALLGFGESLFQRTIEDTPQPWLATGFEVATDLSGATITIREGVQFHSNNGNFGNLTAEDVAWSMNQANLATNPDSNHRFGRAFGELWGEWRPVNSTTIKFNFKNYKVDWADVLLSQAEALFAVFSKQAFDEKGKEWARDNVVATGPYQVEQWVGADRLTLVNRYDNGQLHYLPALTPQTERITLIQAPEAVTRVALIRVGEVDAAIIRPEEVEWLVAGGFMSTASSYGDDLVFNPNKVLSWEMGRTGDSYVGDTWNLVLQPQ